HLNFCARRFDHVWYIIPLPAPFYHDATFPNDWPLNIECKFVSDPGGAGCLGYPRVGVRAPTTAT
ncbi:hypothetical protein C7212DRAFT_27668, partial [Tuber magnatum]